MPLIPQIEPQWFHFVKLTWKVSTKYTSIDTKYLETATLQLVQCSIFVQVFTN